MKKKADLHVDEVPAIAGHSSRELTDRCPDLRKVFPATPCGNLGCDFAIRERQYMNCMFVAAEAGEHTLEAIGEMMGLTREGVRLIERKALLKVRQAKLSDGTPIHQSNVAAGRHVHAAGRQSNQRDDEPDHVSASDGGNVAQCRR